MSRIKWEREKERERERERERGVKEKLEKILNNVRSCIFANQVFGVSGSGAVRNLGYSEDGFYDGIQVISFVTLTVRDNI